MEPSPVSGWRFDVPVATASDTFGTAKKEALKDGG